MRRKSNWLRISVILSLFLICSASTAVPPHPAIAQPVVSITKTASPTTTMVRTSDLLLQMDQQAAAIQAQATGLMAQIKQSPFGQQLKSDADYSYNTGANGTMHVYCNYGPNSEPQLTAFITMSAPGDYLDVRSPAAGLTEVWLTPDPKDTSRHAIQLPARIQVTSGQLSGQTLEIKQCLLVGPNLTITQAVVPPSSGPTSELSVSYT